MIVQYLKRHERHQHSELHEITRLLQYNGLDFVEFSIFRIYIFSPVKMNTNLILQNDVKNKTDP